MALVAVGSFMALDHLFEVEVDDTQAEYVTGMLQGLEHEPEVGTTPDTCYRLCVGDREDGAASLYDGDEVASMGHPQILSQVLLNLIDRRATTGLRVRGWTVASSAGGTVILVAAAGGDASVLTARLLLDGAALVSEGLTDIDPEADLVRAFHRPLLLDTAAFRRLEIEPPSGIDPCGCGGALLVTAPQLGCGLSEPSRPTVIAFLEPALETMQRLSPAAMLTRLLDSGAVTMGDRASDLDTLARLVASTTGVELGTANLPAAGGWVSQLLGRRPPDPVPTLVEAHDGRIDVFVGQEAVIVGNGQGGLHHLNPTASAVWLLHTDGLSPRAIAAELSLSRSLVDDAMRHFAEAGLAGR